MKKILLPVDGTERSRKSIELIKENYRPEEVYIILLTVREDLIGPLPDEALDPDQGEAREKMNEMLAMLKGYHCESKIIFGRAGEEIIRMARKEGIDIIVMTKSTKKGWIQTIGSVTAYVVKYAPCMVLITPES